MSRWLLQHDGAASIRRTVAIEAVIGLMIVGLAAGMVAQPPRAPVPSTPFSQTITASGVIAGVTISPGSVGSNDIHVLITPPGGSIQPVASVTGRVSLPSANIPFSPITLTSEGAEPLQREDHVPEIRRVDARAHRQRHRERQRVAEGDGHDSVAERRSHASAAA